jgi:deoxyadenosine/deoxycytidine kinase
MLQYIFFVLVIIFLCVLILFKLIRRRKQIKLIAIEGNIGVGKTTLLEYLKKNKIFKNISIFVPEPVDMWTRFVDVNGKNILDNFYADKTRWGFTFQSLVYYTRMIRMIEEITKSNKSIVFLDRSLGTDKNVFEKMLFDDKIISRLEHALYNMWDRFYEKYIAHTSKKNIIYLKCDPIIAYSRIQRRGRIEEKNINIEYLIKLHQYHNEWITQEKKNNGNILIIDCNNDIDWDMKCDEILRFIRTC